jgi:serine/threonine-protein kinase
VVSGPRGDELLAGRYRVAGVLGVGGMGTVVRAHDDVLDRWVAIKFLRDDLAGNGPAAARFRREARIAASLAHPGIGQVYDFADDNGRPFIVMELLDGTDLQALVARGEPFEPAVAAGIVARAAEALGFAHAAGAVHRDVKPANIVLTKTGAVKVTDFGIASAAQQVPLTETGKVLGTSWYVSPEQARGEKAGPASDVYALGCVLYQLLVGRPPYEAESTVAVAMAHVSDPVPSAVEANPAVPPALDAVARKAMAKDPAERYADGVAMAAALEAAGSTTAPLPAAAFTGAPAAGTDDEAAAEGDAAAATGVVPAGPPTARLEGLPPTPCGAAPVDAASPPFVAAVAGLAAGGAVAGPADPPTGTLPGPRRGGARRKVIVGALVLGALLVVTIALSNRPPALVALPDWTGLSAQDAAAAATRAGFGVRSDARSSLEPKDRVLAQEPGPGARVPPGSVVTFAVSLGDQVKVPDVRNGTLDEATSVLSAAGLKPVVGTTREVDDISSLLEGLSGLGLGLDRLGQLLETQDVVAEQDPAPGTTAVRGDEVRLTIVEVVAPDGDDEGGKPGRDRGKDKDKDDD